MPDPASDTRSNSINVAIIGGGMGCVCLAIGLLNCPNIHFHICEAASNFAEIGARVALGPNAQRALQMIGYGAENAYLTQVTRNTSP